jgi:hypothetical protein
MELKTALETINQAINVAMQKGCFNLTENQAIIEALVKLNSQPDVEFGEIEPLPKDKK